MAKPIRVLLYYKYLPIENAEQFAADHLAFCKSIGLVRGFLLWVFPVIRENIRQHTNSK